MVRNLVAVVVGCVYVASSIWVVQSVGQAHRAGLNERMPSSMVTEPPPSQVVVVENTRDAPPVAAPTHNSPRMEPASTRPAPAPLAVDPPRPTVDREAPVPPSTEIARSTPGAAQPKEHAPAISSREKGLIHPLGKDPFWSQPWLTIAWDVANLRADDERRLRDQLHELIVRFNPLVEDPSPWVSRVEDAAEPLLKSRHRKEVTYKFFILNSDVVNAFSIPGGNVYISRGLFDLIGEDEDYALQFAIGHEMAHVDLEHAVKCLRDPGVMNMKEGTLQKLFMLILPFGYLEIENKGVDQEFDADDWVANRMLQLGRTRRETLVFLQKLEGYSKTHGFYDGRVTPQAGAIYHP